MKRQEKYPDTNVFHYYNANPKNRITTDCVIRAISTACDKKYNDVVMDLAKIQCETGYDDGSTKAIDLLMKKYGWIKKSQPRKIDNTKYTGEEFCKDIQNHKYHLAYNKIVANIGGHHIVAIIDGKIFDIWNSSNKCIGNYWIKV